MKIKEKLCGVAACAVGCGLLYLDYIIVRAIGALGSWIADMVGATGGAHTGITLLVYIPVFGFILLILGGAGVMFKIGVMCFGE